MIMNNTKHTKEQIRERIQQKKILFDGAFGTPEVRYIEDAIELHW